jgi:hypothetical protein
VRETDERHQVVFTQGGEGNVANHHHLVVTGFEGDAQVFSGIDLIPLEQLHVHVGYPSRRLDQTFARGIFTDGFEEFAHEALYARVIDHV